MGTIDEVIDAGNGYKIEVHYDNESRDITEEIPEGVHVWAWHRRMRLGETPPAWADEARGEGLEAAILEQHPNAVVLPLYAYEHGGITFSTGRFSCPWDSGQLGVIWTDCDDFPDKAEALRSVVRCMAAIAEGRVFGYVVKNPEDEHIDSCWGFIEVDREDRKYLREQAQAAVDYDHEGREAAARMEREAFAL